MILAYISPSILPSRYANSIHVVQQCDALAKAGVDVTLYAKRQHRDVDTLRAEVKETYGAELEGVRLKTFFLPWHRANNITIALYAVFSVLFSRRMDAILSRNLFASVFFALFSRTPLIVEVHQLEQGFRGRLQRIACRRSGVTVVAISDQLASDLQDAFGGDRTLNIKIFHDAAPGSKGPASDQEKQAWRDGLEDPEDAKKFICGYVGHLYAGRGIEIIEALAEQCPDVLFLVIGGTENDLKAKREANKSANLKFLGHMPHPVARIAMSASDLLLMPYQVKVSIGLAGSDTARWMSPMKMFEYMASGTAFIASDIPVLREVLRDGDNATLVPPDEVSAWKQAIDALRARPELREAMSQQAYQDYQDHYTWQRRAERIQAVFDQ